MGTRFGIRHEQEAQPVTWVLQSGLMTEQQALLPTEPSPGPGIFVLLSDLVVDMELQADLTFQVLSWGQSTTVSLPFSQWSPILFP